MSETTQPVAVAQPRFDPTPAAKPAPQPQRPAVARPRLDSVDRLRGLVMVLMALDHVRDFFGDMTFYALDLTKTNVALYFTRWISHFCAPTFVFLTGVGTALYGSRGRSTGQVSWYLFSRGLWIVILEGLVLTPLWRGGDFSYHFVFGQVFWAIGASMMVLSLLVWLPRAAVLIFALLLIEGHNAFDSLTPDVFGSLDWLWRILHAGGNVKVTSHLTFQAAYPLIPWVGVLAAGYVFGPVLRMEKADRRTWVLGLGAFLTVGFFVLRATNVYGDLFPWKLKKDETFTVLSFLDCYKYPPSLCYLMMTLGPALLLLAAFEANWGPLGDILTVFGRVPMFYYLLHLPLILGLALLTLSFGAAQNGNVTVDDIIKSGGLQFSLPLVYAVWLLVILILYFPCRWYAGVKSRSKSAWLTYL
jgi:uncharacterized membrane protein